MALIPEDPKQQKALIAGVTAIAVLYLANSFWLDPKRDLLQADQEVLEALEVSNRTAQLLATRGGRGLEERMALYERHIAQLERLIPGQEQLAALINDINGLARSVGVEIQGFRPDGSEPVGAYTKESYLWSATGEFHDIARFLTRVASMERIVTPVDLTIELFLDPLGAYQGSVYPILATFRLQTYVIQDEGDGAAPLSLSGGDG